MIRLYSQQAELILLLLAHKTYTGEGLTFIRSDLRNFASEDPNLSALVKMARSHDVGTIEDVMKAIKEGLIQVNSPFQDGDLVDTIVANLQLDYQVNQFSGETLKRLRKAILLPNELAGLQERLKQREMACGRCGKDLHDGEGVTLVKGEGGTTYFCCFRCNLPSTVACQDCEAEVDLSSKARGALGRMKCKKCREVPEPRQEDPPDIPHNTVTIAAGMWGNPPGLPEQPDETR